METAHGGLDQEVEWDSIGILFYPVPAFGVKRAIRRPDRSGRIPQV
jgi:hypothetical protein